MNKHGKVVAYILIFVFTLGIIWCCNGSVKFFLITMSKKNNELKIDQGLGYTPAR